MGPLPDLGTYDNGRLIKCVVFDFDGTLVDSNTVKRSAYFEIFAALGATHAVVKAVLEGNRERDRYQIIDRILRNLVAAGFLGSDDCIDKLAEVYAEQYNCICEEYAATCREITGASVSLGRLAKHYTLYVNSATPEEPLCRIVDRRGWGNYFKGVLGSSSTKTENLKRILECEMIGSNELVFVGDEQRDLEVACLCACCFIGVMNNSAPQFESQSFYLVRDLSEIETIINQMDRRSFIPT